MSLPCGKIRKTRNAPRLVVGISFTSLPHYVGLWGREMDRTASGRCAITVLNINRPYFRIMLSKSLLISKDNLTNSLRRTDTGRKRLSTASSRKPWH
jgi:hypothetical protein